MNTFKSIIKLLYMITFDKEFNPEDFEKPYRPVTESITRTRYIEILALHGIIPISLRDPLDGTYERCSKEDLDKIASRLVLPADRYVLKSSDCEDYGLNGQCIAAFDHGVSAVRLALGYITTEYHGYLHAVDLDDNLWLLEPNAGFSHAGTWFKPGENGYQTKKSLL